MKKRTKELDVDFIGEQGKSLTKEEELAISAFIQKLKEKNRRVGKRKVQKLEKQPV